MIGKKKKRDNNQPEESENSSDLFKNRQLIEYQNKALAGKVKDKEERLERKTKLIDKLEKRLKSMAEVFGEFNLGVTNLSEEINRNLIGNDLNPIQDSANLDSSKIPALSTPIEIFAKIVNDINGNIDKDLASDHSDCISTQLKSHIKSISANIMNIFDNVISTIAYENELKKEIDDKVSSVENKIVIGLKRENELLRGKNQELVKSMQGITDERNKYKTELQSEKINKIINEDKLKDQKALNQQLKSKNFSLSRKVDTHPSVPFIYYEKVLREKMLDNHTCVCHICGIEVGVSAAISKKDLTENKDNFEMIDETGTNLNNVQTSNEEMIALSLENENLRCKIQEQAKNFQLIKLENEITENKIISSKEFKNICSQAENLLSQLDKLRATNYELQKEKSNLINEKLTEMKTEKYRLIDKIVKLEKENVELSATCFLNTQNLNNLNLKIATTENLNKSTNSELLDNFFSSFDEEKQKWTKQLDIIVKQKMEYSKKYEDEYAKNLSNEKLIIKLSNEKDKLNQSQPKSDNLEKEYQKFDPKERDKMKRDLFRQDEKIKLNEKTIKELNSELKNAKDDLETMINELQVNENGLGELQKKFKDHTKQISESNEKMAKMMNEKLKDNYTIKLQNEQNEKLKFLITELNDKITTNQELQKKLENIIDTKNELINELETDLKLKDELICTLKKEFQNISKISEQNSIAYEETLKSLKDTIETSSKNLTNYEQMRAKSEELSKMMKLDPSWLGNSYDDLISENEVLKLENDKYKAMVKCKVCLSRNKDVILLKCFHLFCRECIDNTIKNRSRICPACRESISTNDVHSIFLD